MAAMVSCEQTTLGVLLPIKAHAGARRNAVTGTHDGALKISVSQAPEKGKANSAIIEVLADALKISKNRIELYSGQTSSQKKFLIRAVTVQELMSSIEIVLQYLS